MLNSEDRKNIVAIFRKSEITQDSIQSASRKLGNFYDHAEEVVDIWQSQIYQAQPDKILPLMYIANDVLQNSKRKGSNFIDAFLKCMKACLRVSVGINPKVTEKLKRITKVWGQRQVYSRAIITKINGAFNENDNDHDGTPDSTPDPSLLVSGSNDSPAYTPSPIFSDGDQDEEDDEEKETASPSSSSNNNKNKSKQIPNNNEEIGKNAANEETFYQSSVAKSLCEYKNELSMGSILYKRVKDIDFRQYTTNYMLNQIGNFQINPQNAKERIKNVARLVKQYQNHLKTREEQHQQIMQLIASDIKHEENEIENINEKISDLEDSKEYLREIQEQNDNPEVLILRKKRKKTTEMLREGKNPKLDFGDDDLYTNKDGDTKEKEKPDKSEKKRKKKKQAMIWDNVRKCMVPLYSNEDWRDH